MWTSVSGLLVHGEKMNVIGNNISNVNTVGFKAQRMDFQDYVYQYMGTANGMGQVGRGTSIGIIMNDFDQGALETTTDATDIAITGNGFFAVKPKTNQTTYYTRAGNFRFDKDGFLVDPHGYVLQGWSIDREFVNSNSSINRSTGGIVGTGPVTDIRLDTFTCPPRHTTQITLPLNLKSNEATANDKSQDVADPFFAMLKRWDASDLQVKPLGDSSYAFQSTMEVYDEGGRLHTLTVYFDRVTNSDKVDGQHIANDTPSEIYWEFLVTMDPADDVRDFSTLSPDAISTTANVPDALKGILGAGTITFSSDGTLKDMSCFVPAAESWWSGPAGSEVVSLDKFVSAPISPDGFPLISPNFSGAPGQASAYGLNSSGLLDYTKPNQYAAGHLIALDFGLRTTVNDWSFPASMPTNTYGGMAAHSASALASANGSVNLNVPVTRDPNWTLDIADNMYKPFTTSAIPGMTWNSVTGDWTAAAGLTPDPKLWTRQPSGKYTPIPQATNPNPETVHILQPVNAAHKEYGFGMDGKSELLATNMTCHGEYYYEHPGKRQDGYTYGDLRYVNVGTDGVLSASYSNGVTLQLFQLTLYDFPSKQNLRREGGNLFTETRESGIPSSGAAGTGVFGTTQGYSIEQSNADLAREFVNMITTQRGFQANSKSITTVDTMLETVIQMKR